MKKRLNPTKVEIDLGVSSQGKPSPYVAMTHMTFESREQLVAGYAAAGQKLLEDKPRFTDIEIVNQVSEVIDI